jgi:predicted  nucleic acid-binding Zn-ribbon protein
MAISDAPDPLDLEIADARDALGRAKEALIAADAAIEKKENDLRTSASIGEREIADLESRVKDAQSLERWAEAHDLQQRTAARRGKHTKEINKLESELGSLRGSESNSVLPSQMPRRDSRISKNRQTKGPKDLPSRKIR